MQVDPSLSYMCCYKTPEEQVDFKTF